MKRVDRIYKITKMEIDELTEQVIGCVLIRYNFINWFCERLALSKTAKTMSL